MHDLQQGWGNIIINILIDALMYLYVYAFIKHWDDVNYINGNGKGS